MVTDAIDLPQLVALGRVLAPTEVERSTGTVRYPEKLLDWDARTKDDVLGRQEPLCGPVYLAAVIPGPIGRAALIGPFDSPDQAHAWWEVPFNQRLRGQCEMVLLPADAAPEGGRR